MRVNSRQHFCNMDRFPEANNHSANPGSDLNPIANQFIPGQGDMSLRVRSLMSEVATTQHSNENRVDEIQRQMQRMRMSNNANNSALLWQPVESHSSLLQSWGGATMETIQVSTGFYDKIDNERNTLGASGSSTGNTIIPALHGATNQPPFNPKAEPWNKVAAPQTVQSSRGVVSNAEPQNSVVRGLNAVPHSLNSPHSGLLVEGNNSRIFHSGYEYLWTCPACRGFHPMESCLEFLNKSVWDRKQIMAQNVCARCLRTDHQAGSCRSNIVCSVPRCRQQHHGIVHDLYYPMDFTKVHPVRQEIVPVLVRHANSCIAVLTHAYLTPLIRNAVCTMRLLKKLHVGGILQSPGFRHSTHGGNQIVALIVQGVNSTERHFMSTVHLAGRLLEVNGHILDNATAALYSKTLGIELTALEHNDLDLMIGLDVLGLSRDSGVQDAPNVTGDHTLPRKRLSVFGWSLLGPDYRLDRKYALPSSNPSLTDVRPPIW